MTTSSSAVVAVPVPSKTINQGVPTTARSRSGMNNAPMVPAIPGTRVATTNAVLHRPLRSSGLAPGSSRVSMGMNPDIAMTEIKVIAEMAVLVIPMTLGEKTRAQTVQNA